MKISLAQIKSSKGDLLQNVKHHLLTIDKAAQGDSNAIFFPELSLTGYEPQLADQLAVEPNDPVLDIFQARSNQSDITIGVGCPVRTNTGICIAMIIFNPFKPRSVYFKSYLHVDERPFFVSGYNPQKIFEVHESKIAIAICYEISIAEHALNAIHNGAQLYLASVAKSAPEVAQSKVTLSAYAAKFKVPVLMVNAVGACSEFECAGSSAIWEGAGKLLGELDHEKEGLITYDTEVGHYQHDFIN